MGPCASGQNQFCIRLDATPGVDDRARRAINGDDGTPEAALQVRIREHGRVDGQRLPAQLAGQESRQPRAIVGFARLIAVYQARRRRQRLRQSGRYPHAGRPAPHNDDGRRRGFRQRVFGHGCRGMAA